MTRLRSELIEHIPSSLAKMEQDLVKSTGHDLLGLAIRTTDGRRGDITAKIKASSAAIVPISSGRGVIPGFADAVQAVLAHIGCKAWVTGQMDVSGLGEAFERGADVLFAADDRQFLALHLRSRTVIDNDWATGEGFAQALAAAAAVRSGSLVGQKTLVLGSGRVGSHAIKTLQRMGAAVFVYDVDRSKAEALAEKSPPLEVVRDPTRAFQAIDYVLDATPAAGIIDASMVRSTTVVSSPGVPHGLTQAARRKVGRGFIHDNLALGVAVMAVHSLRGAGPDSSELAVPR